MDIFNKHNLRVKFKAHTYIIKPKTNKITIQTDNKPYLGSSPCLITSDNNSKQEMTEENKKYSKTIPIKQSNIKYHIFYEDTGNTDKKNGKDYEINSDTLEQKASFFLRQKYNQPVIHAIKSGKTNGKLIYKDKIGFQDSNFINNLKQPTILLTKEFTNDISNPNLVGIIYTSDDTGSFSHLATQLRTRTDVCGTLFNSDIIKNLKKLEGQNIELEMKDNFIKFNKTAKLNNHKSYQTINVPELEFSDKILSSNEYTPNLIGAKAVNLGRLEKLANERKIDVIIPKSIALPSGYIEKLLDKDEKTPYIENPSLQKDMDTILKTLQNNDIKTDKFMIRSSFNGEDLPNYSAAGIYRSDCVLMYGKDDDFDKESLFYSILLVAESKNSTDAKISRKQHNIPEDKIKPGILLQDNIDENYKFTIYTNDGNNNLKIDLFSNNAWEYENAIQPHVFTYDRKKDKLTYDSIQMENSAVTFDENMNIINSEPIKNDLSGNKKLFEQLNKLVKNALVIEKEFGAPQDIEGGIKDNDLYVWQTRNIVRA